MRRKHFRKMNPVRCVRGRKHWSIPQFTVFPMLTPNGRCGSYPTFIRFIASRVMRCGARTAYTTRCGTWARTRSLWKPDHYLPLSQQTDENVAQVLRAYVSRIADLKKDRRFRYVTVFRNQGKAAGQDLTHPHSEITATPFIPRRIGYELR